MVGHVIDELIDVDSSANLFWTNKKGDSIRVNVASIAILYGLRKCIMG